jgi:hypothetical protein
MAENDFPPQNDFPAQEKETEPTLDKTPTPMGENQNIQKIKVNEVLGPLVVFFGPRDIGKTVTLLRLCSYLDKFQITPNKNFRQDTAEYEKTIAKFNEIRKEKIFAPDSTGGINFLLLDVVHNGTKICQILEAPGEHYFDKENPTNPYPTYLNQIFQAEYKKIYVFFFSLSDFKTDNEKEDYANKISQFVRERIRPQSDRAVVICTKCDESGYMQGAKPNIKSIRNELFKKSAMMGLNDALIAANLGYIPFVPFSAGTFNEIEENGKAKKVITFSDKQYPEELWKGIYECIEGRGKPWWESLVEFFQKLLKGNR